MNIFSPFFSFSKKSVFLIACFLFSAVALAAPPDDVDPTPTPTGVPIDGGASLLLAAGAAYGAKKIYDFRKKKEADQE